MEKKCLSPQIIQSVNPDVKEKIRNSIKVRIHVPDHLHDRVRQHKINTIYDILRPDKSR